MPLLKLLRLRWLMHRERAWLALGTLAMRRVLRIRCAAQRIAPWLR